MLFLISLAGPAGNSQPAVLPLWFWVVLFVVLVVILIWLWLQNRGTQTTIDHAPTAAVDNLEIIEGIGPKISRVLQAAGITTYAQLAATESDAIKQILRGAGLRLGDPTTWPQQAALARDGKMDELKQLQDSLNAGRQ